MLLATTKFYCKGTEGKCRTANTIKQPAKGFPKVGVTAVDRAEEWLERESKGAGLDLFRSRSPELSTARALQGK
jgi:hypothetical protein